jgi:hypothetical protein
MSDTDLLFLYSENVQIVYTVLAFLTTVLFAYLAAIFITVHRLSWPYFSLLSALHFLLSSSLAAAVSRQAALLKQYTVEISRRIAEEGSSISFLNAESLDPWAPIGMMIFWAVATVISIGFAAKLKMDRNRVDA